tara:strand:- start:18775 stop:19347 length:573 start_codon:yes stop_codon:yes gene_type:complete
MTFSKYNVPNINLPSTDDYESPFRLFNKSKDQNLFNLVDSEQIKLGGSPLMVYKYFMDENVDDVYLEDRRKTIAVEPIRIYGHYDPKPIEENLTQFGTELTNDQMFTFNKSYVERRLGRPLVAGDIIKPEFQDLKYEVYEVQEDSFENYGVYHLICSAKLLRDTKEIHQQKVSEPDDVSQFLNLEVPHGN